MKTMATRRQFATIFVATCVQLTWTSNAFGQNSSPFDDNYAAWDALLKKHVKWLPGNRASRVDYKGFAADRVALRRVLAEWSAVTTSAFSAMPRAGQMAFLINAYNGFTIELVLTKYPDLQSIKDIGSLLQSAWKKKFFTLLGEERHLDWIEHEQLRPKFNDPRVHAAVNCASIGCPALMPEAFTAARLEPLLDDGLRRFVGDRSRNRMAGGTLQVNAIFKWFREDFEKGHQGYQRLEDVFARHADLLTDVPADRDRLRAKTVPITFLDYDWSLNDLPR